MSSHPHPHPHRHPGLSAEARDVHAAATPIDLHADTTKLMSRGYDFYQRHDPPWPVRSFFGHVDLPRMKEGNHRAQFFGMWTFPKPEGGGNVVVSYPFLLAPDTSDPPQPDAAP